MATEFVGIELNLMGYEGVRADLQNLDRLLNSFRGKKKFDAGFSEAKAQVVAYKGELERLQRVQASLAKKGVFSEGLANKIGEVKNKLRDAQQAVREFGTASRNAGQTFKQAFNSISSRIAHIGGAMQSLGNALTRLTNPFARLTTGLVMGAGYKALNLLTEGFSGAFERYDTMKNYEKSLKALGLEVNKTFVVGSGKAQTALENLNDAVLGLPTGLDEIVAAQKVYAGATGEMEKSTKTAIAANNAFLASGMGSREQRFFQKYMVALASGAELTTTQWQSMGRIAPLVMRAVAEELDYGGDKFEQFNEEVRNGTISGQEFLDAFIEVGTNGKVQAAANVMKTTWEGLAANIQNATRRMGEGLLKALDSAFESYNGRNLVQNLLGFDAEGNEVGGGIKHWLDGISESLQNWVKAHPDEIIEFFDALKGVDWKSLARGFGEGLLALAKGIEMIAKAAEGKDLSWIGHWMTGLNILGKALSIGGGIFKGLRHPLALLFTIGKFSGKFGKMGIFGKIASIFGKKKDITAAGESAKAIPTVADTFKSAFSALQGLITASGAVLLVSGTGFVAFKSAKSILNDLKDMVDLVNGGGWDNVGYVGAGVITAIGTFTEIFNAIGKALGPQGLLSVAIASAASMLVTGSFAADMALIKSGVKNIRKTIEELDATATAIENMKGIGTLGADTKKKFSDTVKAINEIKSIFVGKSGDKMDRGKVEPGLSGFSGIKLNGIKNLAKALKEMNKIINEINALGAASITYDPSRNIERIKSVCDKLQGIRGPKNIVADTTAVANALYQIRRMAYSINKLGAMDINTSGFSALVSQLKTALASLKELGGELELDITVKLSAGFEKSVTSTINKIKKAKQRIKSQKKGISITIPVSVTFSVSSNFGSALSRIRSLGSALASAGRGRRTITEHVSTGGLIYRAKGGNVPFRRRGTDTVPAMLTPGEYVHNKQAVNTFGLDFMRKVNNLDVKGAMGELMHRAGGMANVNRGTVITNNYNNNQKVTINNNNPTGAGFTFKSASRFVGAF